MSQSIAFWTEFTALVASAATTAGATTAAAAELTAALPVIATATTATAAAASATTVAVGAGAAAVVNRLGGDIHVVNDDATQLQVCSVPIGSIVVGSDGESSLLIADVTIEGGEYKAFCPTTTLLGASGPMHSFDVGSTEMRLLSSTVHRDTGYDIVGLDTYNH